MFGSHMLPATNSGSAGIVKIKLFIKLQGAAREGINKCKLGIKILSSSHAVHIGKH